MATDLTQFGLHVLAPDVIQGWQKIPGRCFRLWGSTWGGQASNWFGICPSRGTYDWTAFDALLAKFAGRRLFYTFGYIPYWANGGTAGNTIAAKGDAPTKLKDAVDFITAVATRARGKIAYYSPINEPGNEWWTADLNQKALGPISKSWVSQHYAAVKAADPQALVTSPEFMAVNPFLQADDFYATGYGQYCDVHAIHSYPIASAYRYRPEQALEINRVHRRILAHYGRPSTMLWSEGSSSFNVTNQAQLLASAAIYPLIAASDAISMFNWYAYDGAAWGQLGDRGAGFAPTATAHREAIKWVTGATWTAPIARIEGPNQIRNAAMVGGATGQWPTNWGAFNPDSAKGISVQVVGVGTESATPYLDVHVLGTAATNATGYVQVNFETSSSISCSTNQLWTETANLSVSSPTRGGLLAAGLGHSYFNGSNVYYSFGYSTEVPLFVGPSVGNPYTISQPTVDSGAVTLQPYVRLLYAAGSTVDFTIRISAPTADTGSLYTGAFTKAGGYQGMVLWDANGGPSSFIVPAGYAYLRDWTGTQLAAPAGSTILLTQQPVLLENQPLMAWVH